MYLYCHQESGTVWCEEEELDLNTTDGLVEPVSTLEKYLQLGDEYQAFFEVSQSKVKTFRKCHRAYHYKYILKLRKRIKGKPLLIGSAIHESIELWLKGKPHKKPVKEIEKEISKMFVEEQIEYQDVVPLCEGMVDNYIEHYHDDSLTPVEVELEIRVPLIDNIVFVGKVDSLQEESKKRLWQVEHKTCASIPDEKNRMSDIQTVLYHWALPRAGYPQPIGVIWDYLRKKLPTVPGVLKNGGLSKNKKIDTTHGVYLQAIHDNELDPSEYKEFLEDLKGREDNFFRRIKMPIAQSTVDSVVEDLKSTAIQMKHMGHIVKDRNMTRDCSWCDYYQLCQSELRGGDTDQLIKREYTTQEQRDGSQKKVRSKVKK